MSETIPQALQVVLASSSQRRRELIRALDVPVRVAVPDVEEGRPHPEESPREFVLRLSLEKARRVAPRAGNAIVLAADTAVVWDGHVFGKPSDQAEARRMLMDLRGDVNTVVTGVTALDGRTARCVSAANSTEVTLRDFSDDEMDDYVASREPLDKAGAYAVQDEVFRPASRTLGCYLNVVGLPICDVVDLLEELGARPRLTKGWRPPEQCGECALTTRAEVGRA